VFGRKDSRPTQKALRFFKERRLQVSFVDVATRPPAPTELRRFSQRYGAEALLDRASQPYRNGGLAHMRLDATEIEERLLADPRLIRLPLVRAGNHVAVGDDEPSWQGILRHLQGDVAP
jgi:arsenate reductase-like glutaredoxin family protein